MMGKSTVERILTKKSRTDLIVIDSDAPVIDALRKMATYDIGALPVVEDGEIKGIVTERDYARKIVLLERSSRTTPVSEIMSEKLFFVNPTQSVENCLEVLVKHFVQYLLVQDENELTGILSMGDILKTMISDRESLVDTLGEYAMGPAYSPWRKQNFTVEISSLLLDDQSC